MSNYSEFSVYLSKSDRYLFDMARFDAMPGQSPPDAQEHVLKSRSPDLFRANLGILPQYFYSGNAPLTFY